MSVLHYTASGKKTWKSVNILLTQENLPGLKVIEITNMDNVFTRK